MEKIIGTPVPREEAKNLILRNADLGFFIQLWDMYREEIDKPDFPDFMSWLRHS